jgi:4'-phosphopantetheinyl transferase
MPRTDPLSCARVAVWRVSVPRQLHRLDWHMARLDREEQARAERFRSPLDRARYAIGRSTIRAVLACVLQEDAQRLVFGASRSGKPFLEFPLQAVQFNSSHSGDWVLHAITRTEPVGVDVEAVRQDFVRVEDFEAVLAPEELHALRAVPEVGRARALAAVWARKEAYVKATGDGVGRGLRSIAIVDDPRGIPRLLRDASPCADKDAWTIRDVDVGPNHCASVVARGRPPQLTVCDYESDFAH